jgi:hypothetical protein
MAGIFIVGVPLLGGMVCGTVLQIAQRAAGVGIETRITCDVVLMLGGAAASQWFYAKRGGRPIGHPGDNIEYIMFGLLLVATGAVAMFEGFWLTALLNLKDMAFSST